MIAFVLSGGGSLGATQAGMLEALLERDIVPDVLVGTSIGAANAAFLAAEPTLVRSQDLSQLWRSLRSLEILLPQRVRVDTQQAPADHPQLKIVSLPLSAVAPAYETSPASRRSSIKRENKGASLLSGQPCQTCYHDGSRLGAVAPNEEVVRLQADLSVA